MPHERFQSFDLNRVISVISVVLKETNLTISDLTGEPVSMESKITRVVSLCTMKIYETTRLEKRYSGCEYLKSSQLHKLISIC